MSKDDYFSEDEMADILRIKKSTLTKNRCNGEKHPPFIKFGRVILYPKKEVSEWFGGFTIKREIEHRAG